MAFVSPRVYLAAAMFVLFAPSASPALAGVGNPPSNPATSVYVEQIPTGAGSVVAGSKGKTKALSHQLAGKLKAQGGADAAALKTVATSAGLGAPSRARSGKSTVPKAGTKPRSGSTSSHGPTVGGTVAPPGATAAGQTTSGRGSGGSSLLILAAVLILIGLAGAVYWRRQRAVPPAPAA